MRLIEECLRDLDSPTLRMPETALWREKLAASLAEMKEGS